MEVPYFVTVRKNEMFATISNFSHPRRRDFLRHSTTHIAMIVAGARSDIQPRAEAE